MKWGFLGGVARSPAVFRSGEGKGAFGVASACGGVRSIRLGPLWAVQMPVIASLGRKVGVEADGGGRAQLETTGAGSLMRVVSRVVRGEVCARRWVRSGSIDAAIFGGWSPPILIVSRTFFFVQPCDKWECTRRTGDCTRNEEESEEERCYECEEEGCDALCGENEVRKKGCPV